jgi:hypothetical protein
MRILEIVPFSAGICGVWQRAKGEAEIFSRLGHEVFVFSSNAVKGCDKIANSEERLGRIKIRRFPYMKLSGESFMKWDFEKEALQLKPDVIIAHTYRHIHTTKALKVAKKLRRMGMKTKVFLVTHAPFVEGNITRSLVQSAIVTLYD